MQDSKNIFSASLKELQENFGFKTREFPSFTFGNIDKCREILAGSILASDKTIDKLVWIPELEEVAGWMVDTKGKGLFLTGDVGRGKTNIILKAIPLMFYHFQRKVVKAHHAEQLVKHLDALKQKKFIAIDEMGVEPIHNEFGSKYEPMNKLFNLAEAESKIVFISTNLDGEMVLDRYGVRTLDRIKRLCKIIQFKGESLRK